MGDSIGRWEGDTLVVDTTNFTDKTRFRGSTQDLHIVERFTRVDAKTLLYRFTIEDPDTWTKPWTGEYTWPATDELMYEYACHEGNYAMGNILRGARLKEANDAKKTQAVRCDDADEIPVVGGGDPDRRRRADRWVITRSAASSIRTSRCCSRDR